MTRFLNWAAALGLAALTAAPALAGSASPVGSWEVSTGEARYRVTTCGDTGELCAKLVWLRDDERTEENLAVLNKYIVRGAEQIDANEWAGNIVFDGKAYEGKMTLKSSNQMTLKGCSGILCQTYQLTRI